MDAIIRFSIHTCTCMHATNLLCTSMSNLESANKNKDDVILSTGWGVPKSNAIGTISHKWVLC